MKKKQVFEGEIRVYREFESGPTLLIDGECLLDHIDSKEASGRSWGRDYWWDDPDSTAVKGKWRVTIERLDD